MDKMPTQTDNKFDITLPLVTKLIAEQFPQWSHLPIQPVEVSGHDNRTFHLGTEMSIRLPSAVPYAAKVQKEQQWLPFLASHLSVTIPQPIAMGHPSHDYPWHWSIYRWIEGESANTLPADAIDFANIATHLAQFLHELHKIPVTDDLLPGPHNFYRGGPLSVYDSETNAAITQLHEVIDTGIARAVWEHALSSQWNKNPVWIHGDLSAGNILIKNTALTAIIDFGGMGVGDPACDLVIAWTFLTDEGRKIFKEQVQLDQNTWARARGWALWKALITLAPLQDKTSHAAMQQLHSINAILDEHTASLELR